MASRHAGSDLQVIVPFTKDTRHELGVGSIRRKHKKTAQHEIYDHILYVLYVIQERHLDINRPQNFKKAGRIFERYFKMQP